MKKLFALLTMVALLSFAPVNLTQAQADGDQPQVEQASNDSTATDTTKVADVPDQSLDSEDAELLKKQETFHQILKRYFIEGDAGFMSTILFSMIFGLALVIERVIYLNLATTNSKKLLSNLEEAIKNGGIEAGKEICRNTRGPVASIFYQGLMKYDEGLDSVEKSIVAYGSVQMGRLEKGLSWISLFIALAPMLGFLGTVIGMIQAFDKIQEVGDISPTIVAGGIKVALLTTVFGLVVAIILQIFYNYLIAKVDSLVNDMEDSSISLIDILAANKK